MDPIQVIIVADKHDRYCRSCASGRTMKEITQSLSKQLLRRFGDAVRCQFLDIRDMDEAGLAQLTPEMVGDRSRLPLVLIDGNLRYKGLFSPTLIQRDIQKMLSQKQKMTAASPKSVTLSDEQVRRLRMRQLILASVSNRTPSRLSHVPRGKN